MTRLPLIAALLALAACTAPDGDPAVGSVGITIGAAGEVSVTSDGSILITHGDLVDVGTAPPGLYAQARALVLEQGPAVAAGLDPALPVCPGYGVREVRLAPPENGVSTLTARCPDAGLEALVEALRLLIVAP